MKFNTADKHEGYKTNKRPFPQVGSVSSDNLTPVNGRFDAVSRVMSAIGFVSDAVSHTANVP